MAINTPNTTRSLDLVIDGDGVIVTSTVASYGRYPFDAKLDIGAQIMRIAQDVYGSDKAIVCPIPMMGDHHWTARLAD
jgi:hypothetical protein